jgi:hypothetical protein
MSHRILPPVLALLAAAALLVAGAQDRAARAQPAADKPAPFDSVAAYTKGRRLADAFRITDATTMWGEFDEGMRQALGSLESFEATLKAMKAQIGQLRGCVSERMEPQAGYLRYTSYCQFDSVPVPLVMTFVFTANGKVGGFWVKPEAKAYASAFLDYQTKTALQLPFHGEWTVVWGGRTIDQNYHAVTRDQRFAYDIVVVKDGASRTGDGLLNTDYHCFGLPIVAPAAGKVVMASDGMRDNRPGEMNPAVPWGNAVVLDHGNGEFSAFAHFKRGSVRVKSGATVTAGDTLGLCGNSGNSSEPHLHYHLQNTGEFMVADGLPAFFVDYMADDQPVARGEPVKGQRVRRK